MSENRIQIEKPSYSYEYKVAALPLRFYLTCDIVRNIPTITAWCWTDTLYPILIICDQISWNKIYNIQVPSEIKVRKMDFLTSIFLSISENKFSILRHNYNSYYDIVLQTTSIDIFPNLMSWMAVVRRIFVFDCFKNKKNSDLCWELNPQPGLWSLNSTRPTWQVRLKGVKVCAQPTEHVWPFAIMRWTVNSTNLEKGPFSK